VAAVAAAAAHAVMSADVSRCCLAWQPLRAAAADAELVTAVCRVVACEEAAPAAATF